MEWVTIGNTSILATEYFRRISDSHSNVLFISLQDSLIVSNNGKTKADAKSWMFYSNSTPDYLDGMVDWEIVIYDLRKEPLTPEYYQMIDEIIMDINRDVYVIVSPEFNMLTTFLVFSGIQLSSKSFLVGSKVGEYSDNVLYNTDSKDIWIAKAVDVENIYSPDDTLPPQPQFNFAPIQALYITVGQPNSGRREFFEDVTGIIEVEKKGNWQKKLRQNLSNGYSVVFQAMNQARSDRAPAIEIARELAIPVYILWFSRRGKLLEKMTGNVYNKLIYDKYIQSFQEPTECEGYVYRLN